MAAAGPSRDCRSPQIEGNQVVNRAAEQTAIRSRMEGKPEKGDSPPDPADTVTVNRFVVRHTDVNGVGDYPAPLAGIEVGPAPVDEAPGPPGAVAEHQHLDVIGGDGVACAGCHALRVEDGSDSKMASTLTGETTPRPCPVCSPPPGRQSGWRVRIRTCESDHCCRELGVAYSVTIPPVTSQN